MYIPIRIRKRGDQNEEDSPFGTPLPSQYDDPVNPDNEIPASISLDLPAVLRASVAPRDTLSAGTDPHLALFPTTGLSQSAVIGIAVAGVALLILALGILDIFILPSGVRRAFARTLTQDKPSPSPLPLPTPQPLAKSNPLPTVPVPAYFSQDIRPPFSRDSFGSGYSSRYSRTMSFDSGVGMRGSFAAATAKELGLGLAVPKRGYARSIASTVGWRPWDEDAGEESTGLRTPGAHSGHIRPGMGVGRWDEREEDIFTIYEDGDAGGDEKGRWLHEDVGGEKGEGWYQGRIKPGMGVQKRHTVVFVSEVEVLERFRKMQEVQEERDRQNFEMYRRFWGRSRRSGRLVVGG